MYALWCANGIVPIAVASRPSARPCVLLEHHGCAGRAGAGELGRARGLHADHARVRAHQLHRGRDAGAQSSAADGHDHRAHVGQILADLEAGRALPRDDRRIVVGRHEHAALARDQLLGALHAMRRGRAREHHARAEPLGARALRGRHRRGHHHRGRHAEELRRERDRLRVIAGTRRDHAARALLRIEARDEVIGAAQFEGAAALQRLGLEPDRGSELRRRQEWRAHDDTTQHRGRGLEIRERDQLECRHRTRTLHPWISARQLT